MDLFRFMDMMGTHEERKVAKFPDNDDWMVDTCAVTDSTEPFETAVKHPSYNDGKMVIVGLYSTKEAAQEGHNKWVELMTADVLPERLVDVSASDISELCSLFLGDGWRQNPSI